MGDGDAEASRGGPGPLRSVEGARAGRSIRAAILAAVQPPEIPADEDLRMRALCRLEVLDSEPERAFDDIVEVAAQIFGVPIALVSLVDSERQWFKARVGLDAPETPRSVSVCGHVVAQGSAIVVPDLGVDPRFADNPLVLEGPKIRFYAGAPLVSREGQILGTLCVIDREPRTPSEAQLAALERLARVVVDQLELRKAELVRVRREAQAAQAQALEKQFVSVVSHELRTPLTSIFAALRLATAGPLGAELSDELRKLLGVCERNARRMMNLVDDLLEYEKLRHRGLELQLAPHDLRELLTEAVEAQRLSAEGDGLRLELDLPAQPLGCQVEARRITEVIDNLIGNAIKFSPPDTRVHVHARRRGDRIEVCVDDEGQGVPEDQRLAIFERFTRLHASETQGSGLGLAIARILVKLHGGSIVCEESPAGGARFRFDLPSG